MFATALVGMLLGFGGMTAGTTFVQASERAGLFGFLENMFRPPPPPPLPLRAKVRYAALPDAKRVSAMRPRLHTPRPAGPLVERHPLARHQHVLPERRTRRVAVPLRAEPREAGRIAGSAAQTVCVRTCDGYLFPLGRLRAQQDLPLHQAACAAACPNAPTALFTLAAGRTELDQAVSLEGHPYLASARANIYRRKRVENCSCQPPGIVAAPLPIGRDGTVRVGDVVATEDSADIVTTLLRGHVRLADYREARGLSRGIRRTIEERIGTMRRETDEATFRRSLRTSERRAARIRLAEAGFARLRMIEAGAGGQMPSKAGSGETRPGFVAEASDAGNLQRFTPVRVIVPSPFVP